MSSIRLTLLDAMALILWVSLPVGAFSYVSPSTNRSVGLASIVLTIALLGTSVLGMAYRRDAQRGFWTGCFAFGWTAIAVYAVIFGLGTPPYRLEYFTPIPLVAYIGGIVGRHFAHPTKP